MDEIRKTGRGGARAGAGRKSQDKTTVAVSLDRQVADRLKEKAAESQCTVSGLANKILKRSLR